MKDDLSDFSRLEAMKKHPVSSQIDDVFRSVIKESKPMEKKESKLSVSEGLPSLPSEVALNDGEFELNLTEETSEKKEQPPAVDDFELSLNGGVELDLGGESSSADEVSNSDYGEVSLEEDGENEHADELAMNSDLSEERIENLGELSFDDQSMDLNFSGTETTKEGELSLDEIDLSENDDIPSLEQTSNKLKWGDPDRAEIDLGGSELSGNASEEVDSIQLNPAGSDPLSDLNQNELSEDARKKMMEIDEILVMDASKVGIANNLSEQKNLDEPLVSEDLDLGNLNFNNDEMESAPVKEEKPKKKKKESETKEVTKEVGQEFREISVAYTVEMERLQATLSNLRVDRQELLSKIQKFEEEKILQSRNMLSLQAELDEKKIEMTIIRKKLNEEITELKDRFRVQDEKRLILEEKNRFLSQELEKSAQRTKIDVKKVQLRERELEQKLELLKADAETQIRYRDQKILELKRKIDGMEFDMESISQQEKRSVESRFELEDKLDKAIKTLRSAINVLEDEPDRVDALKALKKNIDM